MCKLHTPDADARHGTEKLAYLVDNRQAVRGRLWVMQMHTCSHAETPCASTGANMTESLADSNLLLVLQIMCFLLRCSCGRLCCMQLIAQLADLACQVACLTVGPSIPLHAQHPNYTSSVPEGTARSPKGKFRYCCAAKLVASADLTGLLGTGWTCTAHTKLITS